MVTHKRKIKRERIIRRPFVKPITATIDKAEEILYSKHGKPLLMYRIQRKRDPLIAKLIPLAKNPNKIEIFREGMSFYSLVCFAYKDNDEYVYIAQGGSFIMVRREVFSLLCKAYQKWMKNGEK